MYLLQDVYVPEEHFNATIIKMNHGSNAILNERNTVVLEGSFSKHPHNFGPILTDDEKVI